MDQSQLATDLFSGLIDLKLHENFTGIGLLDDECSAQ